MSREIKFRAWNGVELLMVENLRFERNWSKLFGPINITLYASKDKDYCIEGVDYDKCTLMQFIGLKDDNDKEVYESAIVQDEFGSKYLIVFKDGSFYGEYPGDNDLDADINIFHPNSNTVIIGNIHENPDLI